MRRLWRRRPRRQPIETILGPGPGVYRYDLADPYYFALALSWRWFIAVLLVTYLTVNLGFAELYLLQPGCITNARPGSLADAFFFSVQTFATVGYGHMAPNTTYANIVSSTEIFTGMIWLAVVAGVVFVRFSRPRSRLVFARNLVIGPGPGGQTLSARVANRRFNMLYNLEARMVLITRRRKSGEDQWQVSELHLVRNHSPVELMTWNLQHVIGPESPLAGLDTHDLIAQGAEILVSVSAIEQTTLAPARVGRTFHAADVLFDHAFVDMFAAGPGGRLQFDMRRVDQVVLVDPPTAAPDRPGG